MAAPGTSGLTAARQARALSQRSLAELVGTDEHHIARFEAGAQSCRLSLAKALGAALHVSLTKLFPGAGPRLKKLGDGPYKDADITALEEFGVDIDPAYWTARLVLRNGEEVGLPISGADRINLGELVERSDPSQSSFVTVTANDNKVLVNLDHVLLCHFLYEAYEVKAELPNYDDGYNLEVRFASIGRVFEFQVDPDELEDYGSGQIGGIFFSSDVRNADEPFIAGFLDVDGEYVVLRMADVAMLSVPVPVVFPAAEAEIEDEEPEPAEGL